jgi:CubicO group peptidase (beta-lactamase class C family)
LPEIVDERITRPRGVYGHSWFVDPERQLTVIAFTNTVLEGLSRGFPIALRDAIYRAL